MAVPFENVFGHMRTYAQSDQGLHCPLTEKNVYFKKYNLTGNKGLNDTLRMRMMILICAFLRTF